MATVAAIAAGMLSSGPGSAVATTGTTPLAHPPRFDVSRAHVAPYLGHFVLAARHSHRLVNAAYIGGYNDRGYVEGGLAVYTYGPGGREISWVGRTYEYHYTHGGMTIDVISAANEEIFARLRLRVGKGGRLVGALRELHPVPRPPTPIVLDPRS